MKIATIIARILLGLLFFVFGLNHFLHFLPIPEFEGEHALNFIVAMNETGYFTVVALLQIIGGALLLSGFYVPAGLVLLAPVAANILFFHLFLELSGIGMAITVTVLTAFLIWRYWQAFAPILEKKSMPGEGQQG